MLLIVCPHCGPRADTEFTHRGEILPRPSGDPTPTDWRSYLYERANTAGIQTERWFHTHGCRRFLDVERSTTTNEITSVRDVGDEP
jgi:heterotetrameric sarcosine oxidase delta subunit